MRPTRIELAAAALCAAWAAACLAGEGAAVAVAPAFGLAVLGLRRRPALTALAVSAVTAATLVALGVPEDNPASLAAGLLAAYALGRYGRGPGGVAPLAALAAALVAKDGVAAADVLFVSFVLGVTWGSGRMVRGRTEAAARAAAEAAELARHDPEQLAAHAVAEERARLAGDALALVRRSVEAMQRHAHAAEEALDPRALAAVQEEGRAAVAELRRLLGLLRSEPAPEPAEAGGGRRAARARPRRLGPADVATAAGVLAVCAVDVAAFGSGASAGSVALSLALAATVLLRRAAVAAACALAAAPSLLALAFDAPLVYGFSAMLACGLLAWTAGADGSRRALAALGVLALASLGAIAVHEPGNEAIFAATFALAGLAGWRWGERDRADRASSALAAALRSGHEAARERAVRAERLRLARELHDVASHAVGAMVLQAGAALALRERDPAAARAAVGSVLGAGSEATQELTELFGLLDAGTVGPGGHAVPSGADLPEALEALAARMRGAGLRVSVTAAAGLPDDPALAATAYRIVQEALTNAARYAPGSRVEVSLEHAAGAVEVAVRDDGPGAAAPEGGGFGLVGLSERVRALGGELAAGPGTGGGFAVSARLPVTRREGAPA